MWFKYISSAIALLIPLSLFSLVQSLRLFATPRTVNIPGFPVLYHLPELAQSHVHWVDDVIQPSRLLLSPSSPAFNLSQHQGLLQLLALGGQSIGASASASVPPMNI